MKTVDTELEFTIQPNTTGKQLFDQVTNLVGLRETWYFGLSYVDSSGLQAWLALDKKVLSQTDVKKDTSALEFNFKARFYPENVAEELIQDITRHLFYLQVKEAILNEDIYCPPDFAVLLASYAVQAKYGDYNASVHQKGFLDNDRLLPQIVEAQHSVSKDQWHERIVAWYTQHNGLHQDDAVLEYLKIAQDLEMYGVSYFDIQNKKGSEVLLGVDALGMNIYEKSDRLSPKVSFPWSEIRNVSFSNRKFMIKSMDRKSEDFVFYASSRLVNKRIVELSTGNHELYAVRRKPDSMEIQQLKAQAREEREKKQADRLLLAKEVKEREVAERKKRELQYQLNRYSTQYETTQQELEKVQLAARQLEEKMLQAERERQELEKAQRNAEESRRLAEEAANLEKTERERKDQEARKSQVLLEQKLEEARLKEEEALKLQTELAEAHQKMEENQRALEEARSAQSLLMEEKLEEVRLKDEKASKLQIELEEARQKMEENQDALEESRSAQTLLLEEKLEKSRQNEEDVIRLQTELKESREKMNGNELTLENDSSDSHSLEQQQQESIEMNDKEVPLQAEIKEANQQTEVEGNRGGGRQQHQPSSATAAQVGRRS